MARRLVCLLTLLLVPTGVGAAGQGASEAFADEEAKRWAIRTARMEGAAVNIEEAAKALRDTADRVSSGERLVSLDELSSDVAQLNLRVVSAGLAAEILDE